MILINAAEILVNYNAKAAGKHEKCGVDTFENPSGNLNVWSHIHPTEYARQSESQTPRTVHTSASRPDEVPHAISPTGIASITREMMSAASMTRLTVRLTDPAPRMFDCNGSALAGFGADGLVRPHVSHPSVNM